MCCAGSGSQSVASSFGTATFLRFVYPPCLLPCLLTSLFPASVVLPLYAAHALSLPISFLCVCVLFIYCVIAALQNLHYEIGLECQKHLLRGAFDLSAESRHSCIELWILPDLPCKNRRVFIDSDDGRRKCKICFCILHVLPRSWS